MIIAHPKVKLFVSHGGLLSMQEAVYHAVPVLGLPISWDQDSNVASAVRAGYAKRIEILEITDNQLKLDIQEILTSNK